MFFSRIIQSIVHFFKLLFSEDYMLKFFSEYFLYSTVVITKGVFRNSRGRLILDSDGDSGGEVYVIVPWDEKKYENSIYIYRAYAPIAYFWNLELSLYSYKTNSNYSLSLGHISKTRRIFLWFYIFGRTSSFRYSSFGKTYKSKYTNIELLSLGEQQEKSVS